MTLPQPDGSGQTLADGQRKGDFKAVRENVREYAPAQRRPQADRAGVLGVYYQKPDGADIAGDLAKAMRKIKIEGLTGELTWNDEGQVEKPATAYVIQDGKYIAA